MEVPSTAETQLDLIKQNENPSKSEIGEQKLAEDFDNFLLLLTTQLENQDPTEPLDTNEFTNQLVQFSIAEQSVATNQNLEELIAAQKSNQLNSAVEYIGQAVDAKGNAGQLSNGFASFAYELDTPADSVNIVISDGAGRAVFSGSGPTSAGKNRLVWDGVNSFNSAQEPEGTYFLNVVAETATGQTVESNTFTTGVVSSARLSGEEVVLQVAGTDVKLSDVDSIRVPVQFQGNGGTPPVDGGGGDTSADLDGDDPSQQPNEG